MKNKKIPAVLISILSFVLFAILKHNEKRNQKAVAGADKA